MATLALAAAALIAAAAPNPSVRFNKTAWLEDYAALKGAMQESYANLAWFGSPEGGLDLPALDRRTLRALARAETDSEATFALRDFVAAFHDGHLSQLPPLAPTPSISPTEPLQRDLTHEEAVAGCAAMGYADRSQAALSLPFESLPGFHLEADGVANAFRAGTIEVAGRRIGLIRLKVFLQEEYPSVCVRAWAMTDATARAHTDSFDDFVNNLWFESLSSQLRRFQWEGVAALIVDVGGNGGGNGSADWAARLFTSNPVHSARLLISAAQPAHDYFDRRISALRTASEGAAGDTVRQALDGVAAFEARKRQVASRRCDMSWVWTERRHWNPPGCTRLVDAGWASGIYDYLPAGTISNANVAALLYRPSQVDRFRGSWNGPVYVLTNGTTYSSAELFTAVMRDNGIARTVGARTGGDGCGGMTALTPIVLPHSLLRFRMASCMRLRRDGSNEVAGIAPDLPVLPLTGESARARAVRLLNAVVTDLPAPPSAASGRTLQPQSAPSISETQTSRVLHAHAVEAAAHRYE